MIDVCLAVRGEDGSLLDPDEMGVEALVELIRRAPPDASPGSYPAFSQSVDVLEAVERVMGQAAALRAASVHAVAADTPAGVVADQVVDILMLVLGRSRRSAMMLRDSALSLTHQPEVWAALWRGELDVAKAGVLAGALHLIPLADPDGQPRKEYAADHDRVLADGLAYAAEHTARQLDRHLRRLLAEIDPTTLATRRRRALTERGVWLHHRGDGTADLSARLASEDAERVYGAIRALARRNERTEPSQPADDDPWTEVNARSFDIRMAEALIDMVLPPPSGSVGEQSGGGPAGSTHINVTIPIESLAGLADAPGQVSGYGVIPAEVARRLAGGDARWRHVLTQRSTGAVLDVGGWSYRPPAGLARHVRIRDVTCRFPGCAVLARDCDLDHLVPFPAGPTSADNLHALCRRHHRLKHDAEWTVEPLPDHGLRWTSPQGRSRDTWPDSDRARERISAA
jgi:hypothetical protein